MGASATSSHDELIDVATWPSSAGRRIVFLADVASPREERLVEDWVASNRPAGIAEGDVETIWISSSRRARRRGAASRLDARLAAGDDPLMAPLRVVWRPPARDGVRAARLTDLLTFSDPRDPGPLRERWLLRRHPDRCILVTGEPAPLSELRTRWQRACVTDVGQTMGLAEFVERQAALALERGERRVRGDRYKVPRLVREEVLARPAFRGAAARLARELGRSETEVMRQASRYLDEIAARHSPYVIDLVAHLIRLMYTQGYSEALHYDHARLRDIFHLTQRYPVVFLPSHKSNLDHLVLQYALYENGLPPNHTAGGINMNFFPVGPLVRRSGVFFIRRSFKDNPVYKLVLRQYVEYLVEKRFSLEWYVEGGRSRSGKLLPPRLGLLAYVADAYRRGRSEDVFVIPVSIAYDQIQDVGAYVAEQRGAAKQRESLGWFIGVVRTLRRRYGDIHIRFGEPLSLAKALGPRAPSAEEVSETSADEPSLALQKIAFEVSVRINRVTPVTPTSLVTLALLGAGDRALSLDEAVSALGDLLVFVRRRGLPMSAELRDEDRDGVRRVLDSLVANGVVTCFEEGPEAVYGIGAEAHLAAAYYRNTIIHFFVNAAICELALLRAASESDLGPAAAAFWAEAMRLRDALKFEFFFAEKDVFRAEIAKELQLQDPDWEGALSRGAEGIRDLLRRLRPYSAHLVLRPFIDSYRVVSDALARRSSGEEIDEAKFIGDCLGLGKQYQLQRRIRSPESVSKVLFETALRLARNRGLLDPEHPELAARRRAFADELREVSRRIDAVEALAASRRAGLIG